MMLYLLLFFRFLLAIGGHALDKSNSNSLASAGKFGLALNALLTGSCAMIVFYTLNRFSINLNRITLLYALAYSIVCLVAVGVNIVIMRYLHVAVCVMFEAASSIIMSQFVGKFVFGEKISVFSISRVVLMLVVIALNGYSVLRVKSNVTDKSSAKQRNPVLIVLLVAILLNSIANVIISRSFARDSRVCDTNSYFFMTNVFLSAVAVVWALWLLLQNKGGCFASLKSIPKRAYGLIPLSTLDSNLASIVGMYMLAIADVSFLSPVVSALGIIASGLVSLGFREKLNAYNWTALVLAVACVLLPS